jgi:hypothetical protein
MSHQDGLQLWTTVSGLLNPIHLCKNSFRPICNASRLQLPLLGPRISITVRIATSIRRSRLLNGHSGNEALFISP